jgi:hypothetical protein
MIDHVWTVACSRAVIDQASNNVSLESVIEQLAIAGKPVPNGVVSVPIDIVTLWARSDPAVPSKARLRLSLLAPSGRGLGSKELDVDLTTAERQRTLIRFPGMPVSEPGRHLFRVELQQDPEGDWQLVASIPVTVDFVETLPGEAEPGTDE